jgi:hypothetical protein
MAKVINMIKISKKKGRKETRVSRGLTKTNFICRSNIKVRHSPIETFAKLKVN